MTRPFPLFDSSEEFRSKKLGLIGGQANKKLSIIIRVYTESERDWIDGYMEAAKDFLNSHLPTNGSPNTFNRFKSEIERFTLWVTIKHKKNPLELQADDISAYLDFLKNPDRNWVSVDNTKRVVFKAGKPITNVHWCPFWARTPKGMARPQYDSKKTKALNNEMVSNYKANLVEAYTPKVTTISAALRALSAFYNYLIERQLETNSVEIHEHDRPRLIYDKIRPNPVIKAKKKFRRNEANQEESETRGSAHSLTERQWKFTLEAANEMRIANPDRWTRAWFLIAFLKVNCLRVSELCRSHTGTPKMNDIRYVPEFDCWTFQIKHYGKFEREIILPDDFLEYLEVYRRSRGFSTDMPQPFDEEPLLSKLPRFDKPNADSEGKSDMSILPGIAREDIDSVFKYAQSYITRQEIINSESFSHDIEVLKKASAHWLRHTGASAALEEGIDLISLRKNLGHRNLTLTHDHYEDLIKASSVELLKGRKI